VADQPPLAHPHGSAGPAPVAFQCGALIGWMVELPALVLGALTVAVMILAAVWDWGLAEADRPLARPGVGP
jgi:hypothetical protein